jgi:hypothetical protein
LSDGKGLGLEDWGGEKEEESEEAEWGLHDDRAGDCLVKPE